MDLGIPTAAGLYCVAGDFFIDPWPPAGDAFITHAHGDRAYPAGGSKSQDTDSLTLVCHSHTQCSNTSQRGSVGTGRWCATYRSSLGCVRRFHVRARLDSAVGRLGAPTTSPDQCSRRAGFAVLRGSTAARMAARPNGRVPPQVAYIVLTCARVWLRGDDRPAIYLNITMKKSWRGDSNSGPADYECALGACCYRILRCLVVRRGHRWTLGARLLQLVCNRSSDHSGEPIHATVLLLHVVAVDGHRERGGMVAEHLLHVVRA